MISHASAVLRSLLDTLPTFWGDAELSSVVAFYVDAAPSASFNAFSAFVKSACKKIPAKAMLPVVVKYWSSVSANPIRVRAYSLTLGRLILIGLQNMSRMTAYLQLLRRCVRLAPRADVLENTRGCFQVLLSAWDVKDHPTDTPDQVSEVANLISV
jgi:U3 small nucleolar RNA-associated protein 10